MVQPQSVPQKKGMSIWAWVAIGCIGILVLGGVAVGGFVWWGANKVKSIAQDYKDNPELATVKMIIAMNPDLELVSSDEAAGTVTIRNNKTSEVATLNMSDVKEGKISFETSEGKTTMDFDQQAGSVEVRGASGEVVAFGTNSNLPDWVPAYPGGTTQGVLSGDDAQQLAGSFAMETGDSVAEVFAFYKEQLENGGYKVTENRYSGTGGEGGIVVGESADGKRTLTFTVAADGGKTKVAGSYVEKKG
jgi:hypothetical protein